MRYHYLTINTGHCSHHDSDIDVDPAVITVLRPLLQAGGGPIPGFSEISCQFSASGPAATLSVMIADAPLWITNFYIDDPRALSWALTSLRETHDRGCAGMGIDTLLSRGVQWPARLLPPGLATLVLPTAGVASQEQIQAMADFAKCAFVTWASDRFNTRTTATAMNPPGMS